MKKKETLTEYLKRVRWLKICYLLVCLRGKNRYKWLKKHDIFGLLGEKVLFQPIKLPNNPKLIKIHDNVKIASNVTFYEHDVINSMFANVKPGKWSGHHTCIEIFDNTFIGGGSILVGNLKIGPNAIVAAGSVVVKDVLPGTIVGGNPAKVIGNFDNLLDQRYKIDCNQTEMTEDELTQKAWERFYIMKNGRVE